MEYTTIQTLSSVVARCSAPLFPYSIGTRYIPRRYPCYRTPIFESTCFSAFSRTRSTCNIRHYRTALCQEGIFSEAAAHLIQFPQIGSQQRIRLRFRHAAGASGGKTARFTGTATENLRTGHANHRIGGIGPDQRTIQQGYPYAESHRSTKCFGNRCGLRQEAQTTGAERQPAEERRARSGKIIDEQQSGGRSDRRSHLVKTDAGHHRFRTETGAGTLPGTA